MTRAIWMAGLALLLAGCNGGTQTRNLSAVIDADLERGEALLRCRESSSGTCHALFVTETDLITAQAKAGETATAEGLGPATRYCVGVAPPDPGACNPKPLAQGEQIVRSSTVER